MLISTAACDNGDGMLWSSSDEDGSVRSGCEEDESTVMMEIVHQLVKVDII